MSKFDNTLIIIVQHMQKVAKRFKRNNNCTIELSDNMKQLRRINSDLYKEDATHEQR